MNKELPKMYQNKISKKLNNMEEVYSTLYEDRSSNIVKEKTSIPKSNNYTVEQKIYNIFNSKDYIYKVDVYIETDEGTFQKRIIGKNKDNLITMDNEYIPISKIKDIYR